MGRDELTAEIERYLARMNGKELDIALKIVRELICLRRRKPAESEQPKEMNGGAIRLD